MTATDITAVPAAAVTAVPDPDAERRAAYFAGLRALAAKETCLEVPLPYEGRVDPVTFHFLYDGDPCAAMAAAARALGGPWRAHLRDYGDTGGGAYCDLLGEPGGLKVRLTAYRDAACEPDAGGAGWRCRPALAAVLAAGTDAP